MGNGVNMNKTYFFRKKLFAVIFLLIVYIYSGFNLYHTNGILLEAGESLVESLGTVLPESLGTPPVTPQSLENSINSNMLFRMNLIEIYGFVQVLLDKREFNNFTSIKDESGSLHYSTFYRERSDDYRENALRLRRLQDYVEKYGTKVMLVITPSKYNRKYVRLRMGLSPNDPDSVVDELLFYANQFGITTLDLRDSFPNNELDYPHTFFKTDHHWTVPAAFYASKVLRDKMNEEYGLDLDPDGYYTDHEKSYDSVTYHGGMLGSMGRKTGAVFSGVDDFTAYWPRFEGHFVRETMTNNGKIERLSGSFEDTFINKDALDDRRDIYSKSQYSLYLNELRVFESIVNEDEPDGPEIFMIRDSYFSPVISFMAPYCSRIDAMWSLEESDAIDIETYVKENRFDYIIMEVYPYNIEDAAFNFFKGEK